jgi:hypothetical protein
VPTEEKKSTAETVKPVAKAIWRQGHLETGSIRGKD